MPTPLWHLTTVRNPSFLSTSTQHSYLHKYVHVGKTLALKVKRFKGRPKGGRWEGTQRVRESLEPFHSLSHPEASDWTGASIQISLRVRCWQSSQASFSPSGPLAAFLPPKYGVGPLPKWSSHCLMSGKAGQNIAYDNSSTGQYLCLRLGKRSSSFCGWSQEQEPWTATKPSLHHSSHECLPGLRYKLVHFMYIG